MSAILQTDIVILGGTPAGIAAAIAAARLGRSVLLIEPQSHLGGMSTSGLGKSDVERRHLIGGLFQEFTQRIHQYYLDHYEPESKDVSLCQNGYYFEPSVAETVFHDMLEHPQIKILTKHRLVSATTSENRLIAIEIIDTTAGTSQAVRAQTFIDATYEGDLFAAAGADFRLGRESRNEFNEPHAGQIYFDYQRQQFLPGSTGAGDDRLPAYTYRLCLTTDPANAAQLTEPPPDYDRSHYLGYFEDLAAGRLAGPLQLKPGRGYEPAHFNTMVRAFSITPLPNRKTDVNINPRPLGFPFPELNRGYVMGDTATRLAISTNIRNRTLGLLWFLQNDKQIPPAQREIACQYHLPSDEFTDNDHFPWQLYIREARRLKGEFTLTERQITHQPEQGINQSEIEAFPDTIAIGEFPIDSFPCQTRQPGDTIVLEGYLGMLDQITRPYEIPYRIMIPQTIDGLIVPVAASTTHVAFSSIRMEPTWMALGQAAGIAAHLAIQAQCAPRNIPINELQQQLARVGQILKHHPASTSSSAKEPLS
ncbi:FAD-dependent oxidoreductase [Gimesia algae]|uniref:Soluble pyridine nucleotide transhydrogenase n=1 Tax=Gimesia algae TaxID=2527971 RepID=A0A517V7W5_9PLAN|nr:FAD-dependent oxidoreductase [Gimesia algae]QDT89094.1 soluble pyridine nucleotide transhydrogenase [Gimesia algae]